MGSGRTVTRKDVEVEVTKWLTGSRDREGGRRARLSIEPEQENGQGQQDDDDV